MQTPPSTSLVGFFIHPIYNLCKVHYPPHLQPFIILHHQHPLQAPSSISFTTSVLEAVGFDAAPTASAFELPLLIPVISLVAIPPTKLGAPDRFENPVYNPCGPHQPHPLQAPPSTSCTALTGSISHLIHIPRTRGSFINLTHRPSRLRHSPYLHPLQIPLSIIHILAGSIIPLIYSPCRLHHPPDPHSLQTSSFTSSTSLAGSIISCDHLFPTVGLFICDVLCRHIPQLLIPF